MEDKQSFVKRFFVDPGIFTLWLVFCVFILDTIFVRFGLAAGWPALFVALFFFEMGLDPRKLKNVFGGAATGLIVSLVMPPMFNYLTPIIGHLYAILATLTILIFVVMSLESVLPALCNNVTFTYIVLSFLFIDSVPAYTFKWLLEMLLGGAMLNFGLVLIAKKIFGDAEDGKEPLDEQLAQTK